MWTPRLLRVTVLVALCSLTPYPLVAANEADPAELLLAAAIRAQAMRPVAEHLIREEATRIAATLSSDRRQDLIAGRLPVEELVAPRPRPERQSGDLRSLAANALGDAESELIFVPVPPCRILDTRLGGGLLAANTTRNFFVAGTGFDSQGGEVAGCGVPLAATTPLAAAVAINFIAVGPLGPGNLRAWEFGQLIPAASVVNYSNLAGLNIANGVIVPIAGVLSQSFDLSIRADVSGTHVVADVSGYFTRFPVERVKTTVSTAGQGGTLSLADGACHEVIGCTITAPVAGRVVIMANTTASITHAATIVDGLSMEVETANPVTCGLATLVSDLTTKLVVPASYPAFTSETFSLNLTSNLLIAAGATTTYRISGKMFFGAGSGDSMAATRVTCLFVPN